MGKCVYYCHAKCACCHKGAGLCSPAYKNSKHHLTEEKSTTTFTNQSFLLTGNVLGTVGLLAACGGNSSKNETSVAGDDSPRQSPYNEDRLPLATAAARLSADGWSESNISSTNGYTAGNLNIQAVINSAFTGGFYAIPRRVAHERGSRQ